jgi:Uma2 family endonuclease
MDLELLKNRKKELGLTNQQLAMLSGISLGTINKIFSGATKSPQMDTLNALLPILKLNYYDLREDAPIPKVQEAAPDYHASSSHDRYTTDDLLHLPDGMRAELIDGQIYYMSSPTHLHQSVLLELAAAIHFFIRSKKGGCQTCIAPFDIYLDENDTTCVQTDLSIICEKEKIKNDGCHGAPDWIIEIVSPSSRKRDYIIKLNKYWTAGVKEYWIVDPDEQKISVYPFHSSDEAFSVQTYSFRDKVPVGIYEDFIIDFADLFLKG